MSAYSACKQGVVLYRITQFNTEGWKFRHLTGAKYCPRDLNLFDFFFGGGDYVALGKDLSQK